jgi:hypothetical protein
MKTERALLELPRDSYSKEPTFDTIGAGGASQGRHYNRLKLDDIIGEDARDSETVMRRINRWFNNVNSLLTRIKIDGWDMPGTHWAHNDTYHHALKTYGVNKKLSVMRSYSQSQRDKIDEGKVVAYMRGAIENNQPIFGEEFTMEMLNILRKDRVVWAAQYANNPLESGLTEFDPTHLKFYNVGNSGTFLYVFDGQSHRKINVWQLDRCILIDPSMGETEDADESGIVVTGTDRQNNVYILETVKKRLKPPELIDEWFRLLMKWFPRVSSIEEVAFSAIYRYWFEEKCRQFNLWPNVQPYKPGTKRSKRARIRGLSHISSAGQIHILEGMSDFREEHESFPLSNSEHLLDALAQGPTVWNAGLDESDMSDMRAAEEMVMAERDEATGY